LTCRNDIARPPGPHSHSALAGGWHLQAGLAPRAVDAECFDEAALTLGDEYGFSIGAAEGGIGWLVPPQGNFAFAATLRQDR
jgi:hypothetical protein